MTRSFAPAIYALTLFLSALLLFSVQPLFSRMILPLLGGTPQVWTTAMLFFQLCLLAGYAYAHLLVRGPLYIQFTLQLTLMLVFALVLPLSIPADSLPPATGNPALWQLTTMLQRMGGPFFILASMAPLLQHWYSRLARQDASNPYFLYAASNLGSLLALLSYPFIVEPFWPLSQQSIMWLFGYAGLFILLMVCMHVRKFQGTIKTEKIISSNNQISWKTRLTWLFLAFIPSSLMLGVTTSIATDIASVPLLWIIPLALYIASFIIVFSRIKTLDTSRLWFFQKIALIIALILPITAFDMIKFNAPLQIAAHLTLFFLTAWACHKMLADKKPEPKFLTEFYLIMSLGGALGGIFNAIPAPAVFNGPLEYPLILALTAFMPALINTTIKFSPRTINLKALQQKLDSPLIYKLAAVFLVIFFAQLAYANPVRIYHHISLPVIAIILSMLLKERYAFGFSVCLLMMFFAPGYNLQGSDYKEILLKERNFFGTISVVDGKNGERFLLHGTTNHGAQALDEKHRLTPISYYSKHSPIHDVFEIMDRRPGKQNVAVIGLGVGVTACLKKTGRTFDFFEIDPNVVKIASDKALFTYLSDCGSPHKIILGDGRLRINEQADKKYDLIFIDVYSSDNIPVHMITTEAIEIFLRKLKANGILIFNISNKFMDIEPVLTQNARALNVPGYGKISKGGTLPDTKIQYYAAQYFAITKNQSYIKTLESNGWTPGMSRKGVNPWTDQYSNIVGVLGNDTGNKRAKMQREK